MENFAGKAGLVILIISSIRIFKFVRHKVWLYIPLFRLGGIAIGVGFIFLFGADPGWAGGMSAGFAGIIAVFYKTYLEKKFKKQKKKVIKFIKLNKRYKVYIYRWGLFGLFLSGIGLILIAINSYVHWRMDILKTKKNPEFNCLLEQFFYLMGWVFLLVIVLILVALIIELINI